MFFVKSLQEKVFSSNGLDNLWGRGLFLRWYGKSQLFEDGFHVLPDLSAVVLGIVAKQIRRVISWHKLYGFCVFGGVIIVESASNLADR